MHHVKVHARNAYSSRALKFSPYAPAETWKYKRNSYYHSNAHSVGESEVLLFEGLLRFPGDEATAHTQQRFGLSGEVNMTYVH